MSVPRGSEEECLLLAATGRRSRERIAVVALSRGPVRTEPAEAAGYVGVNVLRDIRTGR
ncbi:hypothetical protein Hesp01_53080 [Herbidospora sp. NBRC 101105]|nr:hypothetical protein Hesp01_53080 [Herbidospora sp. NBRC 101105]